MDIQFEDLDNGALCVMLQGRLDTVGVDRIDAHVNTAVAVRPRDVALDLSKVSFLASMGVRLIITLARSQKSRGQRLVRHASSTAGVLRVIEEPLDRFVARQRTASRRALSGLALFSIRDNGAHLRAPGGR